MSKLAVRRAAMQLVYENMFGGEGGDDTLFGMVEFPADDEEVTMVYDFVNNVASKAAELDGIIASYSPKRAFERIPGLCRAVLRLALYELRYCPETPESVVINEAVEMTRRFSVEEDGRFVNGVLGNYVREHPRQ